MKRKWKIVKEDENDFFLTDGAISVYFNDTKSGFDELRDTSYLQFYKEGHLVARLNASYSEITNIGVLREWKRKPKSITEELLG